MRAFRALLGGLAVAWALAGCGEASSGSSTIRFTSPAVQAGGVISPRRLCGGGTLWLPLKWGSVPDGTDELAVYIGRYKYETVGGDKRLVASFGALISGIDPALHGIATNTFPTGVVPAGYFGRSCPPVRTGQNILLGLFALDTQAAAAVSLDARFGTRLTEEALGVEQPATSSQSALRLSEGTLARGQIIATYGPK